jgi:hypothetical protein
MQIQYINSKADIGNLSCYYLLAKMHMKARKISPYFCTATPQKAINNIHNKFLTLILLKH